MTTRRRFLGQASAFTTASAFAVGAGWSFKAWPATQVGAPASGGGARKLVVLMLRGAIDGLSVVVPFEDRDYQASRSNIRLGRPGEPGGVMRLNRQFGLHPALARLLPLWESQSLSFVHASGSPDASRSHFDAQDYWESGTPGVKSTPDGWMNRLLATLPGPASPTRALSMGATPARIFSGTASVASLGLGPRALDSKAIDDPRLQAGLAKLYAQDPGLSRSLQDSREGRAEMQRSMAKASLDMGAHEGSREGSSDVSSARAAQLASQADQGAASARSFAADARRMGQLIRRDPHTQLAFTSVGGWDTHVNQGGAEGQLANKLASLGEGLEALSQGLGDAMRDTVIVVCSEFGRTLRQNGTGGTDHGRGNVMWLMGGPVAGAQVLGEWPGLDSAALVEGRDLAVTSDFRQVFAALLQRHLGVPDASLAQVFPGLSGSWRDGGRILRA
ncbi:DUF1501 domain-containing protein [Paucibacter sp. Y2R2-4]|uniref:DUF1501 domain-containing protein n=1 Tax=Paucibacter sp. Y2R2-4 TaxID=2893553 RepID=UPI0021E4185A|nr:DUF1501 domain-containing protein [Paucibacter sp. Y2R2-4]MCV2348687.1 DUF1501 domain-containing protein [Paucibacter sp. Y2R2-4]